MDYKHIEEFTKIYEDHIKLTEELNEKLEAFKAHQNEFKKLEEYYYSEKFTEDFDASNKGDIPSEINQGILTEDAIYDALGDNYFAAKQMLDIANTIIQG